MDNFYPRLNFGLIEEEFTEFKKARFVVLPIPYDATTSFKTGAREGGPAIINASQFVELYDHELDLETYLAGIHTLPEMIPALGSVSEMVERIYSSTQELLKQEKTVVVLGGDHSVSIGAVKAHLEKYPGLSVLQLDAHPDLRDSYEGSSLSSATAMRRALDLGAKITQVGIRAWSKDEEEFAKSEGIKQFPADQIVGRTADPSDWMDQVISNLGESVYISIDVDVFDPSIMAATGTPEPGGLGWYEVVNLLREVSKKREIVGLDVVELAPSLGPHSCAFLTAKLIYKLMGYMVQGYGKNKTEITVS